MQCIFFLSILLALGGQTLASPLTSGSIEGPSLSGRGVRVVRLIQRQEYQQGSSDHDATHANANGGANAGANAGASAGANAQGGAGLNADLNAAAAGQAGVDLVNGILTAAGKAQAEIGLGGGSLLAGGSAPANSNSQEHSQEIHSTSTTY